MGLNFNSLLGLGAAGTGFALGGPIGAAVGLGGASIFAGDQTNQANTEAQREANLINLGSSRENREWQTEMSNTAYQRATADMRKAGINPMLAGLNQSSASTPSGNAANAGAAKMENVIGAGLSSALQTRSLVAELDQKDTASKLNTAMATKALQDTQTGSYSAKNLEASTMAIQKQMKALEAKANLDVQRSAIDSKLLKYDSIANRVNRDSTTARNLMNILKPGININRGPKKGQGTFDLNTGEVLNERY